MSQMYGVMREGNYLSHKKHHKYIRREKINGKWRYWYEDPKIQNKISQAEAQLAKEQKKAKISPLEVDAFKRDVMTDASKIQLKDLESANILPKSFDKSKYEGSVGAFFEESTHDSLNGDWLLSMENPKTGKSVTLHLTEDDVKKLARSVRNRENETDMKHSECLIFGVARGADPNMLMHKKDHLYIMKKKINGKWRYYYDKLKGTNNIYDNIKSSTYEDKKKQIMETQEWKDIVARKDPEYVRTDKDGNTRYMIDDYIMNKKHPIIDGLVDYGMGRKVTITKQNADTVIAGAKDYVKMGINAVNNIMTAGVGLLTIKLKNQQGSYDKQKREIRNKINNGIKAVNDILETYNKISSNPNLVKDPAKQMATNMASNVLSSIFNRVRR